MILILKCRLSLSDIIVYDEEYYFDKAFHENYSLSLWFKLGGLILSGKNSGRKNHQSRRIYHKN